MDQYPPVRIEILKKPDGSGVLRCTREDGSVTWQKQPKHAAFFALHDLTHYAVETVLGYRDGFFGLLAQGWDMDDIGGKGTRGALPEEAIEVEKIVGVFDSERGAGVLWTAEEFNQFAPRPLAPEEIQQVRATRSRLFQEWFATPTGGRLELQFDSAAVRDTLSTCAQKSR
jgi:hypothetical protein